MKRFVAGLIIVSLLLSVTSCKSKTSVEETTMANGDVDIVINSDGVIEEVEDTNWYRYEFYTFESEYLEAHYNQVINDVIAVDGETMTSLIKGYRYNDEGLTMYDDNFMVEFAHLAKYDVKTGEQIFFTDLSSYQGYFETEDGRMECNCEAALETEENCYVIYKYENYDIQEREYHILTIDKLTGDIIGDFVPSELNDRVSVGSRFFTTASNGSKLIALVGTYGSNPPYVTSGKFIVYDVLTDEIDTCLMGVSLQANGALNVQSIGKIDDTHYGLASAGEDGLLCQILDIETMETELLDFTDAISDLDDDMANLDFATLANSYSDCFAIKGQDYIATLNMETMKFEKSLNFKHCGLSASVLTYGAGVIGIGEDYVILGNGLMGRSSDGLFGIYIVTISENNPYAGRILLTASALTREVSIDECEMITRYNESQDDYYIAIDNSYSAGTAEDYIWNYGSYISDSSTMTSRLAVDLMAGDGPDIILDGFEFEELNNENYLVDLMPYFEGSSLFDNELYFSNAIELARNNEGELYQMPLSFTLAGINDYSVAPRNSVGFTFEEYTAFVSNECNGWDPLSMDRDRLNYFLLLFNNMRDEFICDGVIDLNNEAFYSMAEYCLNNVNDAYSMDDYYNQNSLHSYAYTVSGDLFLIGRGYGTSVRGLPSVDGRGPLINAGCSVGVSSSCNDVDGAVSFIRYALEEDSQRILDFSATPVNRTAALNELYHNVEICNSESDIERIIDPTYNATYYSDSDAVLAMDEYTIMVDSASGYFGGDSDISVILYEEMPVYFEGDKTLEEVIDIIESRAQTVLNER